MIITIPSVMIQTVYKEASLSTGIEEDSSSVPVLKLRGKTT